MHGIDYANLEEFTPEKLAQTIFTADPGDPCTNQILAYQPGEDVSYIFEILCIIMLEGMNILSDGLKDSDINMLTESHIENLNPWFHSLGFHVNVFSFDDNEKDFIPDYYCRILVNSGIYKDIFEYRNMSHKAYHFFINGDFMEENQEKNKLEDLSAIFSKSTNEKYLITFKQYKPILSN